MKLQVTLRPSPAVFTVAIGTLELPRMEVVSEWEGFTKLKNPAGEVLIVMDERGRMERAVGDILDGLVAHASGAHVAIIAGSPALLEKITSAAAAEAAA